MLTPHILHVWTDSMRFTWVAICPSLLPRPLRKEFLEDLITGDESWVLNNLTRVVPCSSLGEKTASACQNGRSSQEVSLLLLLGFASNVLMLCYELPLQGQKVTGSIYANQL